MTVDGSGGRPAGPVPGHQTAGNPDADRVASVLGWVTERLAEAALPAEPPTTAQLER